MARRVVGVTGDGHNGIDPENSVHVSGVYESVLRQWCRREIIDESGARLAIAWVTASDDPTKRAEWEAEVTALAGLLFDERVGAGEPVVAWWYWLPPLPPPLDVVGRADGPRRVRVTADDVLTAIEPRHHGVRIR